MSSFYKKLKYCQTTKIKLKTLSKRSGNRLNVRFKPDHEHFQFKLITAKFRVGNG